MTFKRIPRLFVTMLISLFTVVEGQSATEVENVVVLANANDAGSIEIANYYVRRRGIPPANIIALPMPTSETISVRKYVDALHNPLLNALIEKEWVRVVKTRKADLTGRERVSVGVHRISYLVTTRGVPVRISNDRMLLDTSLQGITEQYNVNRGSVDGELALLIGPSNLSMTGFVPNPLFAEADRESPDVARTIRVSRLDGPDVDQVKRLIDRTLQAETEGLKGRAYFDIGGPYDLGDEWIRFASELAMDAFFDTDCEVTKRLMDETDRFDVPAIYMGWYEDRVYGPWEEPRWPVPPGAIGFHLYSGSAKTVRSARKSWVGAFINQGYCATMGNIYEPYLALTHRPDILLEALLKGRTFGEAIMRSNPVLSWQGVAIGDPLYRPFKVNLSAQLKANDKSSLSVYVFLREINRLQAKEGIDEALLVAQSRYRESPSLPLAYKLAQMYVQCDESQKSIDVLRVVSSIDSFAIDEVMLVKQIAEFLREQGAYELSFDIYSTLIQQENLSAKQKEVLFANGAQMALKSGNMDSYLEWSKKAEDQR